MTIKPIETVYNGYRFRSRLEARWAVFFDTLGIRYEYEKEGYDLDGVWYLPDFWLPELDCWVEIKPENPPIDGIERKKARRLALHTKKHVFILFGELGPFFQTHVFDHESGSPLWLIPILSVPACLQLLQCPRACVRMRTVCQTPLQGEGKEDSINSERR